MLRLSVSLAVLVALSATPAVAQQSSPIVQCQIGTWTGDVPSYACDALARGARHLIYSGTGIEQGRGINGCAGELKPYMTTTWGDPAWQICNSVFMTNLTDARMRAYERQVEARSALRQGRGQP